MSFDTDLENYDGPLGTISNIVKAFGHFAKDMTPLERYLYSHEGDFWWCETTARDVVWTLSNPQLTAEEWYMKVRTGFDWEESDFLKFHPLEESVFPMLQDSIDKRGFVGVALTAYESEEKGRSCYGNNVDHVFVVLPDNKIIHSYSAEFGVKMEDWDYVENLRKLSKDPSLWSSVFGVTIPESCNVPEELYIHLF